MHRKPRWTWRILFAAIWSGGWLCWLILPLPATYQGSWKFPSYEISIFRTARAVEIAPFPKSLRSRYLLQRMLENSQLRRELIEELANATTNGNERRFVNRAALDKRYDDYANEKISELESQYDDELKTFSAETDKALSASGILQPFGQSASVNSPTNPMLQYPYFVANWVFYLIAAPGLLPVATGLLRLRTKKAAPPPEAVPQPRRISLVHKPRWGRRLGVASFGILLAVGTAYAVSHSGSRQWQIDKTNNLRIHIERGCLVIGRFPDLSTQETEIQKYLATPNRLYLDQMPPALQDTLMLAKRIRHGCDAARYSGLQIVTDAKHIYFIVAGWGIGLLVLPLFLPILAGLRAEWIIRRRRRQNACARCNYPLDFLPEPRCPECGWRASVDHLAEKMGNRTNSAKSP